MKRVEFKVSGYVTVKSNNNAQWVKQYVAELVARAFEQVQEADLVEKHYYVETYSFQPDGWESRHERPRESDLEPGA